MLDVMYGFELIQLERRLRPARKKNRLIDRLSKKKSVARLLIDLPANWFARLPAEWQQQQYRGAKPDKGPCRPFCRGGCALVEGP